MTPCLNWRTHLVAPDANGRIRRGNVALVLLNRFNSGTRCAVPVSSRTYLLIQDGKMRLKANGGTLRRQRLCSPTSMLLTADWAWPADREVKPQCHFRSVCLRHCGMGLTEGVKWWRNLDDINAMIALDQEYASKLAKGKEKLRYVAVEEKQILEEIGIGGCFSKGSLSPAGETVSSAGTQEAKPKLLYPPCQGRTELAANWLEWRGGSKSLNEE